MANRDTTITLLIKANAAQLNQALEQAGVRARVFGNESESASRRARKGFDQTRSSVEAIGPLARDHPRNTRITSFN